MSVKTYRFEGEQRTMQEILEMVPLIKASETVRRHLEAGRDTVQKMMAFDPKAATNAGSRKAYRKRGRPAICKQRFGFPGKEAK